MSDLVKRLRQASVNVLEFVGPEYRAESDLLREAADRLEKLEAVAQKGVLVCDVANSHHALDAVFCGCIDQLEAALFAAGLYSSDDVFKDKSYLDDGGVT